MRSRHVFLSPHFDDAVGSCGGIIYRLSRGRQQVLVLTVFGGDSDSLLSPLAQELHTEWGGGEIVARRRAEDRRACCSLGVRHAYLSFPDSIYRRDSSGSYIYDTYRRLFGPPAVQENSLNQEILEHLRALLNRTRDLIYAPMAIGGHVDHKHTLSVALRLRDFGYRVRLYKEFHYRGACNGLVVGARQQVDLGRDEIVAKEKAFRCYQSQIPSLFGNETTMLQHFRSEGGKEILGAVRPGMCSGRYLNHLTHSWTDATRSSAD